MSINCSHACMKVTNFQGHFKIWLRMNTCHFATSMFCLKSVCCSLQKVYKCFTKTPFLYSVYTTCKIVLNVNSIKKKVFLMNHQSLFLQFSVDLLPWLLLQLAMFRKPLPDTPPMHPPPIQGGDPHKLLPLFLTTKGNPISSP